jgi:hypothetical protein
VRINGKNMWVNVSDVADAWGYASDSGDGYGQGILSNCDENDSTMEAAHKAGLVDVIMVSENDGGMVIGYDDGGNIIAIIDNYGVWACDITEHLYELLEQGESSQQLPESICDDGSIAIW